MSTSSKDLMYAILAMDSYNRGYGQGIELTGTEVGSATIRDIAIPLSDWENVGFYAVAYEWNGETIISYRGTNADSIAALTTDIWNGWTVGIGYSDASQAGLAMDFYEAVTGQSLYAGAAANTVLTGHSLGGGLAGFISALSGTDGVGFDHMPFGLAAWAQYATDYMAGKTDIPPDFSLFEGIYVDNEALEEFRSGTGGANWLTLLQWVAETGSPDVTGLVLDIQALDAQVTKEILQVDGSYDPIDLHDQALLVTLEFAKVNNHTDWRHLESELFQAYFNDEIGRKAGFKEKDDEGVFGPAQKMLTAIAYSALEGDDDLNGLVFGNTGIQALFDDSNELGKLVNESKAPMGYSNSVSRLAESIVQFAGQMALGEVIYNNTAENPEDGFLTVYEQDRLLKADLTKELWALNHGDGDNTNQEVEIIYTGQVYCYINSVEDVLAEIVLN